MNRLNISIGERSENISRPIFLRISNGGVYKGRGRSINNERSSKRIGSIAVFLLIFGAFSTAFSIIESLISFIACYITLGFRTRCGR
jgi:hypothetical protein